MVWFPNTLLGSPVSPVNGTSGDVLFLLLCTAARYGDVEAGVQYDNRGSDCSCSSAYSRTRVSAFRAFFFNAAMFVGRGIGVEKH